MSDNTPLPFQHDSGVAGNDPFAPGTIDEEIAALQNSAAPSGDSARLVVMLTDVFALPAEAEGTLERVRLRVRGVAQASVAPEGQHAGADREHDAQVAIAQPSFYSSPHTRYAGWFAGLAAALIVALFAGSFFALLHFHSPSANSGAPTATIRGGPTAPAVWHDVSILKAHTAQPLNFDPSAGIAYAVSDASGIIYACGSNKLWYSQDGGKSYQPLRVTLPQPNLQDPETNCDIATVSGEPGIFAGARVNGQTVALYATPQDTNWTTLQPAATVAAAANPQSVTQVQTDSIWQAVLGQCSCGFGPQAQAVGNWLFLLVQTNQAPVLVGTQDFGQTWVWLDEPLSAHHMTCDQFAVDPVDTARLFCGTEPPLTSSSSSSTGPTQFTLIWQTKDGGKTWADMPYKSGSYLTGVTASATDVYAVSLDASQYPIFLRQPLAGGAWRQIAPFPAADHTGNGTSSLLDALAAAHVSISGTTYVWQTAPAAGVSGNSARVTVTLYALLPGSSTFTDEGETTLSLTDEKLGVSGSIYSQSGRPTFDTSGIGPGEAGRIPLLYLHVQGEAAPDAPLFQLQLPSSS